MTDASAYFGAVAGVCFGFVVFGAGLIGSRLITLAERASTLVRERGDYINSSFGTAAAEKVSNTWMARARRDELANLHALVKEVRRDMLAPVIASFLTGVLSVGVLAGWPDDKSAVRVAAFAGVCVATVSWIAMLAKLAARVAGFTRLAYLERERDRLESRARGDGYLLSGDPGALRAATKAINELLGMPSRWRHPIQHYKRARWSRRAGRDADKIV